MMNRVLGVFLVGLVVALVIMHVHLVGRLNGLQAAVRAVHVVLCDSMDCEVPNYCEEKF